MKNGLSWNDLIFDRRNKDYGAYVLRNAYGGRVIMSFIVALTVLALVIAFPVMRKLFEEEEPVVTPKKTVKYTDLLAPPPIDLNTPKQPTIKLPDPPKSVKFVPPKITPKEVVEEIPTIEELQQAEPSTVTSDGPIAVDFNEPVAEATAEPADDPHKVYMVVQQQPEFPGGQAAMFKWIANNMRYPSQARRTGTEGSVFVEFVVGNDGNIRSAKVIKGIGAGCDEEAVRVISKMPAWKPGKQNGKAVNVRFVLPLKFILG
jgi:protein TonB